MQHNDRILCVDDNADNLLILQELLGCDYSVKTVTSGMQALIDVPQFLPNIVLLDVMMPGLDGVETCRRLRAMDGIPSTRIVMLSARGELRDRLAAYDAGAVDYIRKPFDHSEVLSKVRALMQMVRLQEFEDIWREAEQARQVVGATMLNLASFRDTETGDHLFRVRWYAQLLAEDLADLGPYSIDLTETFLQDFYKATPLHDLGKVGIHDAILRKPGPLTKEEFEEMKRHTVLGGELLTAAARSLPGTGYLNMAAEIARSHHEQFNGGGYPYGLTGTSIPLAARILSVADVFDALTSKRVYRNAIAVQEAARIMNQDMVHHFDPVILSAFDRRLEDFEQAHSRFQSNVAVFGARYSDAAVLSDGRMNEWSFRPSVTSSLSTACCGQEQ